jgi:CRP/FNR family transcriptional regulator
MDNTYYNEDIEDVLKNLNERKKELECIYRVDEILRDFNSEIENIFQQLCDIIPSGWRYPEICKIKIQLNDIIVESENFKKTELKLSHPLIVEGLVSGEITLCYIKSVRAEKGIFLNEELRLFKTITEKINQYLSYRKLKELYSSSIDNKQKINDNEQNFLNYLKELKLKDEEIEEITKVQIEFKKGENICKQGSFATFIMILKDGLVKAFVESPHYKNHVFKITRPFAIIGLSSLYGENYYHFSAQALLQSKICLVERDKFDQILRQNNDFAIEVMKLYSNSLQNIYDKIGCLANKQAIGRVCEALIYLAEKVFESNIINPIITRKDLAEFSGLATENLVRVLSDLKKDNIIAINNKTIEILNMDTLKMLSNVG